MLNGYDAPHIQEFCRQKGWELSKAQIYVYISHARDMIRINYDIKKYHLMDEAIALRMKLYSECKVKDPNTALEILRDTSKLLNRYPAIKINGKLDASKGLVDLLNGTGVEEAKKKLRKD
jgi:hypothetical protein